MKPKLAKRSVGDSVRVSVWRSVGDSVWRSVWYSVSVSVWDSVENNVAGVVLGCVGEPIGDFAPDTVFDYL